MYNGKLLNSGLLISILLVFSASFITQTHSWVYQDGTPEDKKFEKFGPRADRLLIKLYQSAETEWKALTNGSIDTTDTRLTKYWYDNFTGPPLSERINVVGYGPEYGFYILDINNANTTSSLVYPNPLSVLSFREAIAHLVNRTKLDEIIGAGLYVPIWVPMSPAFGKYYLDIPNPYQCNRTKATELLDLDGFPVNSATAWRFWDRNGNGVEDPEEYLELKFVIRRDHPHRLAVGNLIADELNGVKVRVKRIYAPPADDYVIVRLNRDFHLYIASWYITQPDPTYLYYLFHSSMIPLSNYNSINDPILDALLESLMYATNQEVAVMASRDAQTRFVIKSFKVPLWSYMGYKAMYRRYTGGNAGSLVKPDDGENKYRNITWQGVVNVPGWGLDNFFSFLNMHPTDYAYGDGENMTIRHGFRYSQIGSLNPIYASWPWELQVLDLIYDRLIRLDPYDLTEWMSWIVKNFTLGAYTHPVYGQCTKVKFTLRTDVTWFDGTPLTTADVYFTLVELKRMLEAHGFPEPQWIDNMKHILDFKIFDPYNFEVLFDVTSYWALLWIGGIPMLPKHVWKPIIETGDPTGFAPDPNMIGSGPWRLKEYVENSRVLMVANKPSSKVQTNLPGSQPIHSPYGYFRLYPVYVDVRPADGWSHKVPFGIKSWRLNVTLENLMQEATIVENNTAVDLSNPVSSMWNETWPVSTRYHLAKWIDDDYNGMLGPGDIVGMEPIKTTILEWYHVEYLLYEPPGPIIMGLEPVAIVKKYLYLDDNLVVGPLGIYLKPGMPHEQQWTYFGPTRCRHTFKVALHIEEPNWNSWKLNSKWINYTFTFWVTIKEDIVGSYWLNPQLLAPDCRVNIIDIATVARAFGSYPGHPRWSPYADITCDYIIDIRDVATIAIKFGWPS